MHLHHVPLAITDSTHDIRWYRRFCLSWKKYKIMKKRFKILKGAKEWIKENFNKGCTCREGKLYLFINDLHGDEVVFLVEAAVVEQQTIRLFGRKSGKKETGEKTKTSIYWLHPYE